jgi:hypothetical protein
MGEVHTLKRKPRPLRKTFDPAAPYVVTRADDEDGSIRYEIIDERPDSYRLVCATNDAFDDHHSNARRDAEMIARGLNLLVQYGLEKGLPPSPKG